jgi:hypothetical protein
MVAQGLDGHAVHLPHEFPGGRFQLLQDLGGFVKLCAGRRILQVAARSSATVENSESMPQYL